MIAALVLRTRLSERQLEETSPGVLAEMINLLNEEDERAADEARQSELKRRYG